MCERLPQCGKGVTALSVLMKPMPPSFAFQKQATGQLAKQFTPKLVFGHQPLFLQRKKLQFKAIDFSNFG